jgi:glutamate/aspartate transport system substrate-binding protein
MVLIDAGAGLDARTDHGNSPPHLTAYRGHPDTVDLLIARGAEACASDHVPLYALGRERGVSDQVRIVGDLLSFDPYAIALPCGDADPRLLVDRALAGLFRGGRGDSLHEEWFGLLRVPMPELLRAAFSLRALPE